MNIKEFTYSNVDPLLTKYMFSHRVISPKEVVKPKINWTLFEEEEPKDNSEIYLDAFMNPICVYYFGNGVGSLHLSLYGNEYKKGKWCYKEEHDKDILEYLENNVIYNEWIHIEVSESLSRFIYLGKNSMNGTTLTIHNDGLVQLFKSNLFDLNFYKGLTCSKFEELMDF